MITEQDIRTALADEAAGAPQRGGSLQAVVTEGRRRGRRVRATYFVGAALVVAALIGVPVALLDDGPGEVVDAAGQQLVIDGETFPVGVLLDSPGGSPIFASILGPELQFDAQSLGVEAPFQVESPELVDADRIEGPAAYIGTVGTVGENSDGIPVTLFGARSGEELSGKCLAVAFPGGERPYYTCTDWEGVANPSWWIGVPEGTAVVSLEVNGASVAWQRPRSRVVLIPYEVPEAVSSMRLVALDESGIEIAVLPASGPDPGASEEPKVVLEVDGLRLEILSGTGFGKHNIRFWDTREGDPAYSMESLGRYNEPGPGIWLGLKLDADGGVSIHGGAPIDTSQIRVLLDGRVAVVDEFVVREDYGEAFFVARLTDQNGVPLILTDQDGLPLSQTRFAERTIDQGGVEVQALDENGLILETVP